MTLDLAAVLVAFVLVLIVPTYLLLEVRAVRRGLQQLHHRQRQHAGAIIQLQTTVTGLPTTTTAPMNDKVWSGRMTDVTKVTATISGDRSLQPHSTNDRQRCAQGGPVNPDLWGRENGPELFVPYHGPSAAQVSPGRSSHRGAAPGDERVVSGDRPGSREPSSPLDPDETMRLRPPALSDIEAVLAKAARPLTRMEMAAELERQPWELLGDLKRLMLDGRLALSPSHGAEAAYTLADPTTRMASMPILWGAR